MSNTGFGQDDIPTLCSLRDFHIEMLDKIPVTEENFIMRAQIRYTAAFCQFLIDNINAMIDAEIRKN